MALKLQIGVIGLGKFGFVFGQTLVDLGHNVLGVDMNPDNVRRVQKIFTHVFEADARDKKVLEQLGFRDLSHVLISVGESIAASAMISMYLKEMGIPTVLAKAINTDHEKLLRKIGVDEVIIPEHIAAHQFAQRLAMPGFIEYLPFEENVALKQLTVQRWEGKSLRDIDLTNRYDVQIVAVKKGGETQFRFLPKADDRLATGDILVALGRTEELDKLNP